MRNLLFYFLLVPLLGACISGFVAEDLSVHFTSNASTVQMQVMENSKIIQKADLPADVRLNRKATKVLIFSAPGYHTVTRVLNPDVDNGLACASLSLAPFTLGLGFLYDAYKGAFLTYPESFVIRMYPVSDEFASLKIQFTQIESQRLEYAIQISYHK